MYCWKAAAEWNIKMENTLWKIRIKSENNEDENFQFIM